MKVLLVLATVVVLTGCTSQTPGSAAPPDGSGSSSQAVSRAQSAALSDGTVTEDEYESGYRRYVGCLKSAGFEILDNGEINKVHQFGVPAAAVSSGDDERCYVKEFKSIDIQWQISREDTSDTAKLIEACLTARGINPGTTMAQLDRQMKRNNISLDDCLKTAP